MEAEARKRPDLYYFSKANSYANAHNLRKGWFEEMRAEAPNQLIYDAEILKHSPERNHRRILCQPKP